MHFRGDETGTLIMDPGTQHFVPNGLPLNHTVAPDRAVALIVVLDQPLLPDSGQLGFFGIDYLDGTWRPISVWAELLDSCGSRGSTVRVSPRGTLPPGAPLRLRLRAGLADVTGEAHPTDYTDVLPVQGTVVQDFDGARVDAVLEHFHRGGNEFSSMEDTTSDLGAPRALWGDGILQGRNVPGGVSRARSKWYPLGLAGREAGKPDVAPGLSFNGVDANGRVEASAGNVLLDPAIVGPVSPELITPYAVDVSLANVVGPQGLYAAQPALILGTRCLFDPPVNNKVIQAQVRGTQVLGMDLQLNLGAGCYHPSGLFDCAPWDLSALFPPGSGATIQCHPQSFEIWWSFLRDRLPQDHSIRFFFDATVMDADGLPDESAAFSASGPWTHDVTDLSGGLWDFVRFEVEFNLDVSGNGYHLTEGSSGVDFVKIPVDFRP